MSQEVCSALLYSLNLQVSPPPNPFSRVPRVSRYKSRDCKSSGWKEHSVRKLVEGGRQEGEGKRLSAEEGTLETHLQDRHFTQRDFYICAPLMVSSRINGMPATWLILGQLCGSNEPASYGIHGLTKRPLNIDFSTSLSLSPGQPLKFWQHC